MKTACPCCGSEVEGDFPLLDLGSDTMSWAGQAVRLTGRQSEVLASLLKAYPGYANKDQLIVQIWGGSDNPMLDEGKTLSAHISTLRRELQPFGFSIDVIYRRGWRISRIADVKYRGIRHATK